MSKELVNTAEAALDVFADAGVDQYAEPEGSGFQRMKEIRLCVPLTKVAGVTEGHYYIIDKNVEQGEDPIITPIGEKLEGVVILRDAKRVTVYNRKDDRQEFSSSEFRAFTELVTMFDERSDKTKVYAVLPYYSPNGKLMSLKKMKDDANSPLYGLSTRYVTYILWQGEVYRFSFGATTNTGATKDFKPLGFSDYDKESFEGLKHEANQIIKNRLYAHLVTLGSKTISKTSRDRVHTFNITGQVNKEQATQIVQALNALYSYLEVQIASRIERAMEHTNPDEIITNSRGYAELIQGDVKPLLSIGKYPDLQPDVTDARIVHPILDAAPPVNEESVEDIAAALEGGEEKKEADTAQAEADEGGADEGKA
jgi:hypothetical protein